MYLCMQTWELSVEVISSPLLDFNTQKQYLQQLKCWRKCIARLFPPHMHFWETAWKKRWVLHWTANTAVLELALQPSHPALMRSCRTAGPPPGESRSLGSARRAVAMSSATVGSRHRGSMLGSLGSSFHLRIQTFRKRGLKLMCHWEGSAEQRCFWICGCSPLPRFASSLSPRLTPPSSDPQTVHFLGKPLRTFHSPCTSLITWN